MHQRNRDRLRQLRQHHPPEGPGRPGAHRGRYVSIRHLIFYWPGNTEDAAYNNGGKPLAFPALLAGTGSAGGAIGQVTSLRFEDNDVINATDVIDLHSDVSGGLFIDHNRAFFEGVFLNLGKMSLESFIHDNHFTPNAYTSAPGMNSANPGQHGDYILYNYAAQNAVVVKATADGRPHTPESIGSVDGLDFHNNYILALGYGIVASGGTFNLTTVSGNTFDAVPNPLLIDTGGVFNGRFDGGIIYSYTSQLGAASTASTPVFFQSATAAPGTDITISGVRVPYASGQLLDFQDTMDQATVSLNGVTSQALNGLGNPTTDGIRWNAAGRLSIGGSVITMASAPRGYTGACVNIVSPVALLSIVGNSFVSCGNVIDYTGTFGPAGQQIATNVSIYSSGATAYGGANPNFLVDNFNAWDKVGSGWSLGARGSDGAYVLSYQGTAELSLSPAGALKTTGSITPNTTP